MATSFQHKEVGRGDIIKSADWNALGQEVSRLEKDKVDRSGDKIEGDLEIAGSLSTRGDVTVHGNQVNEKNLEIKNNLTLGQNLTIKGTRIRNAQDRSLLATDTSDKLRINPDRQFPSVQVGNSMTLNTGGLSVGDASLMGTGELKVTGDTFLGVNGGFVGVGTTAREATLNVNGSLKARSLVSGERGFFMEAPVTGEHREAGAPATGLVLRVEKNPDTGAPLFQVRSEGHSVRFFVEHEGYTGSIDNSAWFAGGRSNYFKSKVGIGNPAPVTALDISGDIKSTGYAEIGGSLKTSGGRFTVTSGGNVGIGVTEPETKLHINGAIRLNVGEGLEITGDNHYFGRDMDARLIRLIDTNGTGGNVDGGLAVEGYTPKDKQRKNLIKIMGTGDFQTSGRVKDRTGYLVPVGSILPYYGTTAPQGWLLCNGQAIPNEAQFTELRNICGSRVPNLGGMFLRGIDPDGSHDPSGARKPGSYQSDTFKSHSHPMRVSNEADSGSRDKWNSSAGPIGDRTSILNLSSTHSYNPIGDNGSTETRPKNVAVNFIIKY